MQSSPRVAFFADSFHEVNGVALTSRQLEAFARRRGLPFLSVHTGQKTTFKTEGSVSTLELERGPASLAVDDGMKFDPFLWRYMWRVAKTLREFKPSVIHVTGPSDAGILGASLALHMGIPLVASWHTNLHEFAARRLKRLLSFMPATYRELAASLTERHTLEGVALFYKIARVLLAPNPDLIEMLRAHTAKPVFLMRRGVDTDLFTPAKRFRQDGAFTLGYVGRLRPEKNVRFLSKLEKHLPDGNHRFLIVGEGSERDWLQHNLRRAEFTGVLRGEPLARTYANMDLFVFPSTTDTFGSVIQEALASGVCAVVMNEGGPKFLVQSGVTGHVAINDRDFIRGVIDIMSDAEKHRRMRIQARAAACEDTWDHAFEEVYSAYETCLAMPGSLRKAG
jgi:phosphatidylinositol alpha 1,6-mannosyltransferase